MEKLEFNIEDLQKLARIDPMALDKECIRLPTNFFAVSNLLAEARSIYDQARIESERVEAQVSGEVRQDPRAFGLGKLTEAGIHDVVVKDKRVQEAQKNLLEARQQFDVLQAAVGALETKKSSLEMMIKLLSLGYYSTVKTDPEGKKAVEEMTKTVVRRTAGKPQAESDDNP